MVSNLDNDAIFTNDPGAARDVYIVRTGSANLASVVAAVERVGARPIPTSDPADVLLAERLVLPGVGSFGAAMSELTQRGLVSAIRERLAVGRSTLGICLGLQLLARGSEESPGVTGLSLIDAVVRRLPAAPGLRVPQMGWNLTEPRHSCRTLNGGYAYFANSYALPEIPRGWRGSTFAHGESNPVAAIEQGDGDRLVVATQFHPELSGRWGLDLIRRWVIGRPTIEPSDDQGDQADAVLAQSRARGQLSPAAAVGAGDACEGSRC
ncbi:MAG: imidazole glycerol phosphate synthase subunit HisH [Phycisphaeraceae bacterium]|nr:MAG: imidazole glycerol phosphate synthase subunit HisH [Phycisphaeraceae bacterium]